MEKFPRILEDAAGYYRAENAAMAVEDIHGLLANCPVFQRMRYCAEPLVLAIRFDVPNDELAETSLSLGSFEFGLNGEFSRIVRRVNSTIDCDTTNSLEIPVRQPSDGDAGLCVVQASLLAIHAFRKLEANAT